MYYHTLVTYADGLSDRRIRIEFKSSATSKRGLMRALANEVVERLGTDVFEIGDELMSRRYKYDWSNTRVKLDQSDKRRCYEYAKSFLFDRRY